MSENIGLSQKRKAFLTKDFSRGFIRYCGFGPAEFGRGFCESRLRVLKKHRQQDGFVHAGVMATMADHTAGYAAFTVAPDDRQVLTLEFKINFLRPAFGRALICRSRVIREGRRVLVTESEVFDLVGKEERLAAKALLTMMLVPKKLLEKENPVAQKSRGPRQ
jgi:uncharacterized protein (TIGR00369 family)